MLVKRRCFVCNARTTKKCGQCACACYCSKACLKAGWPQHKVLCTLVKKSGAPRIETESVHVEVT